jgi:hypothetical protein
VATVAAAGSMVIADALLSRRPTMPSVSPAARAILARVVLMAESSTSLNAHKIIYQAVSERELKLSFT